MELDEKSKLVLGVLRDNARMPIRDIAKKTGLRPSTVHQRLVQLQQEKVIWKFTVALDNAKVGEGFIVYMLIKTKPRTYLDKVFSLPNVKEVSGVTGEYDLLMKMKFRDVQDFNDFVLKFRKNEEVESTLTMVGTVNLKEEL